MESNVVLITGAGGKGIGTMTAKLFARQGMKVYLNGKNSPALEAVADEISFEGGQCDIAVADVSCPLEVSEMIKKIECDSGGINVLVNNAAAHLPFKNIESVADDEWKTDLDVILSGAFYCCREVAASMRRKVRGSIVFVSSVAAHQGSWGRSIHYTAAKAGLHGMASQLALELAGDGINVNVVAPGLVDTPRTRYGGRRDDAWINDYANEHIPMGRIASPQDIAGLISYLTSEAASFITGQTIVVDGGASLASKSMRPLVNV